MKKTCIHTHVSNLRYVGHKFKWHCFYCGAKLDARMHVPVYEQPSWCDDGLPMKGLTIDHVTPSCRGGTDDRSNLVASCWPCNREKLRRTLEEYLFDKRREHRDFNFTFPGMPTGLRRDWLIVASDFVGIRP
jgi:hypothetical protein